jgi:hypothetical protein
MINKIIAFTIRIGIAISIGFGVGAALANILHVNGSAAMFAAICIWLLGPIYATVYFNKPCTISVLRGKKHSN